MERAGGGLPGRESVGAAAEGIQAEGSQRRLAGEGSQGTPQAEASQAEGSQGQGAPQTSSDSSSNSSGGVLKSGSGAVFSEAAGTGRTGSDHWVAVTELLLQLGQRHPTRSCNVLKEMQRHGMGA